MTVVETYVAMAGYVLVDCLLVWPIPGQYSHLFESFPIFWSKAVYKRNTIHMNFYCKSLIVLFIWLTLFFPDACSYFHAKSTDIAALNFIPKTFKSHKKKFCHYISWNNEHWIQTYRATLSFCFQKKLNE